MSGKAFSVQPIIIEITVILGNNFNFRQILRFFSISSRVIFQFDIKNNAWNYSSFLYFNRWVSNKNWHNNQLKIKRSLQFEFLFWRGKIEKKGLKKELKRVQFATTSAALFISNKATHESVFEKTLLIMIALEVGVNAWCWFKKENLSSWMHKNL